VNQRVLVTGAAGFIGFHLSKYLINNGYEVHGIDIINSNEQYRLKKTRIRQLMELEPFIFHRIEITNKEDVNRLFNNKNFSYVIHLSSCDANSHQIENSHINVKAKYNSFINILEACRNNPVKHLIYSSSSAVYTKSSKSGFSTSQNVDHPKTMSASINKSYELFAHAYSHLYNIPTTGLRLFSVYGSWGNPNDFYFQLTKKIFYGDPIDISYYETIDRDYIHIIDTVRLITKLLDNTPKKKSTWSEEFNSIGTSFAPYVVYNIGAGKTLEIKKLISILEDLLGTKAKIQIPGNTKDENRPLYADVTNIKNDVDFEPLVHVEDGFANFVEWFLNYYI